MDMLSLETHTILPHLESFVSCEVKGVKTGEPGRGLVDCLFPKGKSLPRKGASKIVSDRMPPHNTQVKVDNTFFRDSRKLLMLHLKC